MKTYTARCVQTHSTLAVVIHTLETNLLMYWPRYHRSKLIHSPSDNGECNRKPGWGLATITRKWFLFASVHSLQLLSDRGENCLFPDGLCYVEDRVNGTFPWLLTKVQGGMSIATRATYMNISGLFVELTFITASFMDSWPLSDCFVISSFLNSAEKVYTLIYMHVWSCGYLLNITFDYKSLSEPTSESGCRWQRWSRMRGCLNCPLFYYLSYAETLRNGS